MVTSHVEPLILKCDTLLGSNNVSACTYRILYTVNKVLCTRYYDSINGNVYRRGSCYQKGSVLGVTGVNDDTQGNFTAGSLFESKICDRTLRFKTLNSIFARNENFNFR
jgi:hypothetical protein